MNQTILVDWRLYKQNPYTQDFIQERIGQARMVLLVSDPTTHDYDQEAAAREPNTVPYVEWDVIIRNTGDLLDVDFKKKALNVLQDVSDLIPVIGLDIDFRVNMMYRGQGVLITTEDI